MNLRMQVDLGHGHIVLDGTHQLPSSKRGGASQFSAHVFVAKRLEITFGVEEGLGSGHSVLGGTQLPSPKRGRAPQFRPISNLAKRICIRISLDTEVA